MDAVVNTSSYRVIKGVQKVSMRLYEVLQVEAIKLEHHYPHALKVHFIRFLKGALRAYELWQWI